MSAFVRHRPVNEFKFTVKKKPSEGTNYKEGSFRLDTQETKVANLIKEKLKEISSTLHWL